MSPLVYNPQPRDGPVAITFEFEIDELRKGNAHKMENRGTIRNSVLLVEGQAMHDDTP
jgi:hypothetical protein